MIQEGINSLLTTAGRAFVAKQASDILKGEQQIKAEQQQKELERASFDKKIGKAEKQIAGIDQKIANAQAKAQKAFRTLESDKTVPNYLEYQKLEEASKRMSFDLAIKRAQKTALLNKIKAEKKKRGL